jgi:chemosensory pili system protein ChpA (sensor histidine kinase/response regulator)
MEATSFSGTHQDFDAGDLGPLAWVYEEIRKSLGFAGKSVRRFLRDANSSREAGLSEIETTPLRMACQQLHQAVGALEMVGLAMPAKLLAGMEAFVQKIIQSPELCTPDNAQKLEVCGFSLLEFLQGVLRGKTTSPVALFPQYRDIQMALGVPRIHPADLFDITVVLVDVQTPAGTCELNYEDGVRTQMDAAFLKMVQSASEQAAKELCDISLGLAATQSNIKANAFWKISAAFFEALSRRMLPLDAYVKNTALKILMQYVALSRSNGEVPNGIVRELLFFCAQAVGVNDSESPVLMAVRAAYGLDFGQRVEYETRQFGRVEPAILQKVRKQIATGTETWSAYSGGDLNRLRQVNDQFQLITQSIVSIHPEHQKLARALNRAVEQAISTGQPPSTPIAMEVATAILYLETAYDDIDPTDSRMNERGLRLAKRLDHVTSGGQPRPLESWMEDLYRRVSDRQTMGSVVDELRSALVEIEKALDQYFRQPADKQPLQAIPDKFSQMRGVLSVLGLDQASLAALRMREQVDRLFTQDLQGDGEQKLIFEKLGNSVGALGFFIDMLSYQRSLAKRMFIFDEIQAEFRPLMGREKASAFPTTGVDLKPLLPAHFEQPKPKQAISQATLIPRSEDDDAAELKAVFLQEAREVIGAGLSALKQLETEPASIEQFTILRRAFHSLKGSSRMVGLLELGEAAWGLEQLLNFHLSEPLDDVQALRSLCMESLNYLIQWVQDIADAEDSNWRAEPFRAAADAMRLTRSRIPIQVQHIPTSHVPQAETSYRVLDVLTSFQSTRPIDFSATQNIPPVDLLDAEIPTIEATFRAETVTDLLPALHVDSDQIKVIGDLQVSAKLYNVYLNEADEWSRQLLTSLQEWLLQCHQPIPDDSISWAHSLAGSSATVGFMALSEIARALEHALQHLQLQGHGQEEQARVFVDTAEHIRHLLHQFAAGFLKSTDERLLIALDEISNSEFVSSFDSNDSLRADSSSSDQIANTFGFAASSARDTQGRTPHFQNVHNEVEDAIDPELFPIFDEEARELLPQLAESLRIWSQDTFSAQARLDGLRVLHTLKGSSRLAGAMRMGDLLHRMESTIEQFDTDVLKPQQIDALLNNFDELHTIFESLSSPKQETEVGFPSGQTLGKNVSISQEVDLTAAARVLPAGVTPLRAHSAGQTVRVRAQLLDRLLNQAGEVMITRSRLDARLHQLQNSLSDLTGNLDKLRLQLRDIELHSETQMQSRLALSKESDQAFDPLEFDRFTRVQELTRMMAESVNDVGTVQRNLLRTLDTAEDDLIVQARQARELQQDLLRTRMVEFDSISERLYGVVRQASKDSGKQVRLDIQGGRLEVDRGVLDRMAPSFEHLLRNAVAHGVEDAFVRESLGKPTAGLITMVVQHEGNDVSVTFSDDGAGLDLSRIREKALALGLVSEQVVFSDDDAAQLIFLPGFTTASSLTELSGRGIGMDVVRSEVASLGGRIETATHVGQGTRFTLILPLTTAVTQVLMLSFGGLSVGVPANLVELVLRVNADDVLQAYRGGAIAFLLGWGIVAGLDVQSRNDRFNAAGSCHSKCGPAGRDSRG